MELNAPTPEHGDGPPARNATATLVAVLLQTVAAACAYGALDQLANRIDWSSFTGRPDEPQSTWAIYPLAIGALVLWLASGAAAARIATDNRYWITLLIGPTAIGLYLTVAG